MRHPTGLLARPGCDQHRSCAQASEEPGRKNRSPGATEILSQIPSPLATPHPKGSSTCPEGGREQGRPTGLWLWCRQENGPGSHSQGHPLHLHTTTGFHAGIRTITVRVDTEQSGITGTRDKSAPNRHPDRPDAPSSTEPGGPQTHQGAIRYRTPLARTYIRHPRSWHMPPFGSVVPHRGERGRKPGCSGLAVQRCSSRSACPHHPIGMVTLVDAGPLDPRPGVLVLHPRPRPPPDPGRWG